jgi:hypothetical protein
MSLLLRMRTQEGETLFEPEMEANKRVDRDKQDIDCLRYQKLFHVLPMDRP